MHETETSRKLSYPCNTITPTREPTNALRSETEKEEEKERERNIHLCIDRNREERVKNKAMYFYRHIYIYIRILVKTIYRIANVRKFVTPWFVANMFDVIGALRFNLQRVDNEPRRTSARSFDENQTRVMFRKLILHLNGPTIALIVSRS